MRSLLALALLAGLAAADPEFRIVLKEVSYSQRVDYILGDGARPFADEDQRRAQLLLEVRATGKSALLGWGGYAIAEAASDRGEAMAFTVAQPEGAFTTSRELRADPIAPLPPLTLPLTRQPCAGLQRLAGTVELRWSSEAAAAVRIPLAELPPNQEHAVAGLAGGSVSLAERPGGDGRMALRFNAAAWLALQDVACLDAKGAELALRNRKAEWRDEQGQLTVFAKTAPATLEVRFYPHVERRAVAIDLSGLALGLTLPGREDLRGPVHTGADGF